MMETLLPASTSVQLLQNGPCFPFQMVLFLVLCLGNTLQIHRTSKGGNEPYKYLIVVCCFHKRGNGGAGTDRFSGDQQQALKE